MFNFKKKYGQNFLKDKNIVNKIATSITPLDNNVVIEIGCGDGRLTSRLCELYDNVLGYEIDKELESILEVNLKDYNNKKIIFDDFLNRNLALDLEEYKGKNIYVIANLPYYITTPILEKLIESNLDIKAITVMVQKEVGDRFSAKVGTKEYSSLSVYLNYYFNIKKLFVVSRNCFIPSPNVDSIVIRFEALENLNYLKNKELFFKLVRDSFRFKRKTLKNNLKDYDLDKIDLVLKKYNLDLSVRAEQLSLDIFCDIANNL